MKTPSDCGTNIIGDCKKLGLNRYNLKLYLQDNNCSWTSKPPEPSHKGKVWNRMTGLNDISCMLFSERAHPPSDIKVFFPLKTELTAIMSFLLPKTLGAHIFWCWRNNSSQAINVADTKYILSTPDGEFVATNLSSKHWKNVQGLADALQTFETGILNLFSTRRQWHAPGERHPV